MVKSVLSVSHRGLRDWMIQRVSAILMVIYSIGLLMYFVINTEVTYAEWRGLFALPWIKIASILFFVSLLFHAWVGMWTILTDYVKCAVLRCAMHLIVFLTLSVCFVWAVMILWSV